MNSVMDITAIAWYCVYSPDDNGWYSEVCSRDGKDLYRSPVKSTERGAEELAVAFIAEHYGHAQHVRLTNPG